MQRLEQHTYIYVWCVCMGASLLVLVLLLLSVRTWSPSSVEARWWEVYAQGLWAPTTLVVLASQTLSLLSHELVAVGVQAKSTALQRALAHAGALPPLPNEGAWQDAVLNTWRAMDTAWAHAEQQLTNDLFGWVTAAAHATHDVLHGALDLASDTVDDTLGATPLHDPVSQFVQCVLGSKVHSLDKVLAWAQAHAQVVLPRLPPMPSIPPMPYTAWRQPAQTALAQAVTQWEARTMQHLAWVRAQALCALVGVPIGLLIVAIGVACFSPATPQADWAMHR